MRQPSEADIETAKAYLRKRLDAELSMASNLEAVMREAAKRVVGILYSANISTVSASYGDLPLRVRREIDAVVEWLRETVNDYFLTLAIADHEENRDVILPVVFGINHGQTFEERLDGYCDKFRDELLLLVGAGLALGIVENVLAYSIGANLRKPYDNPLLAGAVVAPSFGQGRTNSMFTAIGDLARFGIVQGWMQNQYLNNRKDGCVGWVVRRGSSYPCDLCDSYVGFHTDESDLPPYHGHCACFAVPIYIK